MPGNLDNRAIHAAARRRTLIFRLSLKLILMRLSRRSYCRCKMRERVCRRPLPYWTVDGVSHHSLSTSTPIQRLNCISWRLELSAHHLSSTSKRQQSKPLSPRQQISQRNDIAMIYHSIVECVTNRPFGHDPAFNVVNNVVQINRVHYLFSYVVHAFERSCVRTHERSNA